MHYSRYFRVLCFVTLLAMLPTLPIEARQAVEGRVRQILNAADLRGTDVTIYAVDLRTGEELVSIRPDDAMMPASNMKLITSAAALRVLGPDYVFRTSLSVIQADAWTENFHQPDSRAAAPTDGVVLIVRGDGDPGFGDPRLLEQHGINVEQLLSAWVSVVQRAGIEKVDRLIIDDRVFDTDFIHHSWPEDQLNRWYQAQVAGVNFHDNCIDVYVSPTSAGAPPRVELQPEVPFANTTNRATTGSNDNFWISRRLGTNEITFRGQVRTRRTQPVNITVHDPALFFGEVLKDRLAAQGVTVGEVMRPEGSDRFPTGRTMLINETTMPLILQRCNRDSMNLFADALLKRVGYELTGQPGGWSNGATAMRMFLQEAIGPRAASVQFADGSGLSRENRVTARVLVDVLKVMHGHPTVSEIYRQSLATTGPQGTLRNRDSLANLEGATIHAKTGYIRAVSALSGYLILGEGDDATPIAFSILCNNFNPPVYLHHMRALQDNIVIAIAEEMRR